VIGETVGSYRIISKLSIGGMGTVYRAEHTLIGKLAAVKVLHPELSTSDEIVQRFFNEAKATTTIKHPGIVEVFDFGYMASGHAFLTMEFLEGMSLARRIKTKGRMPEGEAAMLLRAVCSALSAAHAKGIVHRDLKPDNIFLVTDADSATGDRPKVLDFGIAKLTDMGLAGSATKTGAVMGTPTYMSPEQCKGTGDVDHRADLYSLGCIFYELVVGRPPFTKLGAGELIGAHIYAAPEPPSKYLPSLDKDTEKLIMSLLQKRPEKRPQTAKELGQRLSALAQQLGWITVSSPEGVTARALRDLSSGPVLIPPTPNSLLESRLADTVLPPEHSSVTTPFGLESLNDGEDPSIYVSNSGESSEALEQPTTLSGAASQSVVSVHDLPRRRSRKGAVIALMSVATLAGAAIVAVKVTRSDDSEKRAVAKPEAAAPMPTPTATVPDVKPAAKPDEVKPVDVKPDVKPEVKPDEVKPKVDVAEVKPDVKPPPPKYTPKPPKYTPPKSNPASTAKPGAGSATKPVDVKTEVKPTPPPQKVECKGGVLECPNKDKL
jgi:eukaryotic-like serine/threonine-protein kinase